MFDIKSVQFCAVVDCFSCAMIASVLQAIFPFFSTSNSILLANIASFFV